VSGVKNGIAIMDIVHTTVNIRNLFFSTMADLYVDVVYVSMAISLK